MDINKEKFAAAQNKAIIEHPNITDAVDQKKSEKVDEGNQVEYPK